MQKEILLNWYAFSIYVDAIQSFLKNSKNHASLDSMKLDSHSPVQF